MKIYTNELGHITNMAAMPIYGKNLKKASSSEPIDWWPWNLVCSIVYVSTTKVLHIMTPGWPWLILCQAQGELLWSPCVRRPASVVTRCSRWAIVITLCPASVVSRPSSVVCRQQFIQSTSPPKLLDQFQNNFTQMFPWSSYTKIAKMVLLRWTKWPSELKIEKPLNDISSQANGPISK